MVRRVSGMQTRSRPHTFTVFTFTLLAALLGACPYNGQGTTDADTEAETDSTTGLSSTSEATDSATGTTGDTPTSDTTGAEATGGSTGDTMDTSGTDTNNTGPDTDTGMPAHYCGDGVLDPGEECDAEVFCDHCIRDRMVFVTGETQMFQASDINGTLGADKICDTLARDAGLDGPNGDRRFRAWLSDGSSSVLDRFVPAPGRYARPDGKEVADSWADVLDGTLIFPPRIDMNGKPLWETVAWTATTPSGEYDGSGSCSNWTSSDGNAGVGDPESSTSKWTELGPMPCDGPTLPLICFEQGAPVAQVQTMQPCASDLDCPFGTVCFPALDNFGTLVCAAPCKTDAACDNITGGLPGNQPTMHCSKQGLCEPTLCNAVDPQGPDCDCQEWANGQYACF